MLSNYPKGVLLCLTAFAVSAMTGIVAGPMQILGATLTAAALLLNNLYLRRVLQRSGWARKD